ncbi:glycosyltransferase family 4 protein [Corynebacterium glutamicum]|uniref:glycosyltransferase family 4 protein n=1 Tax=Corynebacterium glutamicum TaxID=1718 RepID=UPI000693F018|nr:glycosyltransferase family 4 protein [Corynebacterium glutamicum]
MTSSLRNIRLLASIIYQMMREDPEVFIVKLAERLRQVGIPGLKKSIRSVPRIEPERIADYGELSVALSMVSADPHRFGWKGKRLADRLTQQIQVLNIRSPVSTQHQRPNVGASILYLLTNSFPYTNSGYTQRSHQALLTMKAAGIPVFAVTRLAYPLDIGKMPQKSIESVDSIRYHRLLPNRYPKTTKERYERSVTMLTNLAKDKGAAAIHTTTNYLNAIVASRVARNLQIPWIYEVRGEFEKTWLASLPLEAQEQAKISEYYDLIQQQEIQYAIAADAVVVLSEIAKDQLIDRGVSPDKISVIPNAVDPNLLELDFDKEDIRRELGLPTSKTLVGSVSSIVEYEGFDVLIHALQELPEECTMVLVGEGTARPGLEMLVKSEGLEDRVIFTGRKPSETIWKWYAALDVFVVPRHDIPVCRTVTPIKALTAQALGIPVVASDLPALREITGGVASYVCADDPSQLAQGIMCASDGSEGREWAARRSWISMEKAYIQLYRTLGIGF